MAKNIIELNGKRYDAVTGKLLTSHAAAHPSAPGHKTVQVIDGVMNVASKHAPGTHPVVPKPTVSHTATNRATQTPAKTAAIQHAVAPHAAAHHPEHAKTLMRRAVKQPVHSLKRHIRVATHTGIVAKKPATAIAPKHSWQTVDKNRLKHAKHTLRSSLVSHFRPIAVTRQTSKTPAPTTAIPLHVQAAAIKPMQTPSREPSTDIFERALAHANSHRQPAPPIRGHTKKSRRVRQFLSFGASSLIAVLTLGFVAYQNVAAIQIHIASNRAGINATLPDWQPSGFSAQKFTYSPGKVVVGFSGDSTRSFSLVQTASNWDSSTLLNEYVSPHNQTYNTIQANGRLIYTYGNNNASWVSSGIWYQLTTNGNLSTAQLVRLATST